MPQRLIEQVPLPVAGLDKRLSDQPVLGREVVDQHARARAHRLGEGTQGTHG
jgi:hypothetical protein